MYYTTVLFLCVLGILGVVGCFCLGVAHESFYKNWATCCDEFKCWRDHLRKKDPEEQELHEYNEQFKEDLKFATKNTARFVETKALENLKIMLGEQGEKSQDGQMGENQNEGGESEENSNGGAPES